MGPVIRRPQRTLTEAEWSHTREFGRLNLLGALILGIVDPVRNPSPMPEDEGAWVREHVWPAHLRESDDRYPWGFEWSACERGTCWNCLADRCDLCVHRQEGGPAVCSNRDWVSSADGNRSVAALILRPGGEECVWWCRCACEKTGPVPHVAASAGEGAEPSRESVEMPECVPAEELLFDLEVA